MVIPSHKFCRNWSDSKKKKKVKVTCHHTNVLICMKSTEHTYMLRDIGFASLISQEWSKVPPSNRAA